MITVVNSVALSGIDGIIVSVEAGATSSPHPRLDIIGLPDAAVKEASGRELDNDRMLLTKDE